MADKKRSAQMDTLKKVLRYIARYRLLVAVSLATCKKHPCRMA